MRNIYVVGFGAPYIRGLMISNFQANFSDYWLGYLLKSPSDESLRMPLDLTDDKSTLVQLMAWSHLCDPMASPGLNELPVHQQPLYWIHRINRSFSSMQKASKYLHHLCVEKWYKLHIHVHVSPKKFHPLCLLPQCRSWHYSCADHILVIEVVMRNLKREKQQHLRFYFVFHFQI